MPFTKNQTETTLDTNEVVAGYTDVVGFFSALGMTVSNANQIFTIISRNTNGQDRILGEVKTGESLVIQYKQVTGPVNL